MLILEARNIRQVGDVADYDVKVKVNTTVIHMATVRGHNRRDGWRELVRMIIDAPDDRPEWMRTENGG